jgi:hypothetical protein
MRSKVADVTGLPSAATIAKEPSMITRRRTALLGVALAAALLPSSVAIGGRGWADHPDGRAAGCARKFEQAQRQDMESFRDFDAETFRAVHDPDAISIFPSGFTAVGIDDIMDALSRHFTDRNAVWAWTELSRRVEGCRTAVIRYDATYDIPSIRFHQRAITVVTYIYERGRWLGILDQGTLLELRTGT